MRRISRLLVISLFMVVPLLMTGCSGLSTREQRVLSGGAIGAASGAAIGAVTGGSPGVGAAVGGAAGAVGGLVVDELDRSHHRRY